MKDNEYRFTGPDGTTVEVIASTALGATLKGLMRLKLLRAYKARQGQFVESGSPRCFVWRADEKGRHPRPLR